MLTKIKKHLFQAGIFIFSVATLLEHAWLGQTNLLCFAKGLSCGITLVGIVKISLPLRVKNHLTSNR